MKKRKPKIDHLAVCYMQNGSKREKDRARKVVKRMGGRNIRFSWHYKIEADQMIYAMVGKVYTHSPKP